MSGWSRLVLILTLRCEGGSELLSRQCDEPLPLAERLALRGHLLACGPCRRFGHHLRLIRQSVSRRASNPSRQDALSPEARTRIARALREAAHSHDEPADGECSGL